MTKVSIVSGIPPWRFLNPRTPHNLALQLPIPAVLSALHELGIQSLMVEGGAQVIASFFAASSAVDTVIVTVAPTFVGANGVGYGVPLGVVCFFSFSWHSTQE
jgi:2,5-diamino-6-(ribosylamino)-4(3H)-pyrimidinone 5'-phosphate reductase